MILKTSKLRKEFHQASNKIPVLNGVDFELLEGESVSIIGQSGSGKSTLLSLLAGLDNPSSGEVWLGNANLATLSEDALAKHRAQNLGIIFQQFHLMSNLSALENVCLPLEILRHRDVSEKATAALNLVGLGHRFDHLPSKLSGGECQRVAIARAFVTEPKLLLADEPSGNLDTATGDHVMNMIFDLTRSKKTSLLLVTHNPELARRCDRVFELKAGTLHKV